MSAATTCRLCEQPNDETSIPVGKWGVRFHKACADRAELELHIAREREKARRQAETVDLRRRQRAARAAGLDSGSSTARQTQQ